VTSRVSFMLRAIYAICLLAAASTHLLTLATHGLSWNYDGAPVVSRIYWTSLTVLDPLAAVLLFLRPRSGLALAVAIILSDVAHNTWLMLRSPAPDWSNWMYLSQVLFLVFVLTTIRHAWRGLPVHGGTRGLASPI
jgi:hypothetical protein